MRLMLIASVALTMLAACNRSEDQIEADFDRAGNRIEAEAGGAVEALNQTAAQATGAVERAIAPAGTATTDAWVGRWTGPEGLFLDVAKGESPGRYALTIKGDLDSTGDAVEGLADGDAIRFTRDGREETLRASDGDGTGLKYLFGKRDCLVVKPGEGFCRD